MQLAILMPVYNEAGLLASTLKRLQQESSASRSLTVFLVDDGSFFPVDAKLLPDHCEFFFVVLARHLLNLGQGAALETARQLALRSGERFDGFVTMDSDGQHDPSDLHKFEEALGTGADVVFGNRFIGTSNVPWLRRRILRAATIFERVLTGLVLGDAHNGYRAFSPRGIRFLALTQNRMAHATEIKHLIARQGDLKIAEVAVSISYSDDTLAKGQSSLGALQILKDLLYQFIFDSHPGRRR